MSTDTEGCKDVSREAREVFEKLYVENVLDIRNSPIGSRDYVMQWTGYQFRQPEIDALQAEVERLRNDAERFRWLCEDHDDKEIRARRNRILECFSVHSYSASCIDIDAAMKEST